MPQDPRLNKLKNQIQEAKENLKAPPSQKRIPQNLTGRFFNVGVELVSGVFIGVAAGLFIDWLFSISPWGLISFFILGSAAGLLNVYRTLTHPPKNKKRPHD